MFTVDEHSRLFFVNAALLLLLNIADVSTCHLNILFGTGGKQEVRKPWTPIANYF
jgi:hypothetical protein